MIERDRLDTGTADMILTRRIIHRQIDEATRHPCNRNNSSLHHCTTGSAAQQRQEEYRAAIGLRLGMTAETEIKISTDDFADLSTVTFIDHNYSSNSLCLQQLCCVCVTHEIVTTRKELDSCMTFASL